MTAWYGLVYPAQVSSLSPTAPIVGLSLFFEATAYPPVRECHFPAGHSVFAILLR